ncbi:MAG: metallophosphoesterase [Planctomycetota bacterium]
MAETFTLAHCSDPHLGHEREPDSKENARRMAEAIAADPGIDLVVITGDLTDQGDERPEDYALAQRWVASLGKPGRVVAGNHDVGAFVGVGRGEVREPACARFDEAFGGDRWANHDAAPGWSLVGVNSMVGGSGLERERAQQQWLTAQRQVAHQRGHAVALCTHAPLFVNDPAEPAGPVHGYWTAPPMARDALVRPDTEAALAPFGLVMSGHLHQCRSFEAGLAGHDRPTRFAWAPAASGSIVDAPSFPLDDGRARTGYWKHTLSAGADVLSTFVRVVLETRVYRADE